MKYVHLWALESFYLISWLEFKHANWALMTIFKVAMLFAIVIIGCRIVRALESFPFFGEKRGNRLLFFLLKAKAFFFLKFGLDFLLYFDSCEALLFLALLHFTFSLTHDFFEILLRNFLWLTMPLDPISGWSSTSETIWTKAWEWISNRLSWSSSAASYALIN